MKKFLLGIAFALVACSSFAQVSLKIEPAELTMKPGDVQEITVSIEGAARNAYEAMQLVISLPVGVNLGGKYLNDYSDQAVQYDYEDWLDEKENEGKSFEEFLKKYEATYFLEKLFARNAGDWSLMCNFTQAPYDYYRKNPDTNQDEFWRQSTTNEINVVAMNQNNRKFPNSEGTLEPIFKFVVTATDRCYTGTWPIEINYVTFTTPDKQSVNIDDAEVGVLTYAIDYTIPPCGYGTLVWPLALDMSANNDFTVNTGVFPEAGKPQIYLIPVPVEGKKIAGNEPVVIIGKPGPYSINTVPKDQSEAVAKVSDNVLEGTVDAPLKVSGSNIFALSDRNGVVGFYRCQEGVEIPQYKAYLTGNASVDSYLFEADGINNVVADELSGDAYTISGVKVNNTNKKGVYIVNGKKVVVK